MFRHSLFLLLVICYSVCCNDGLAQPSAQHYTCYRANGQIRIDGILAEPAWLDIPWSDLFSDIEGNKRPVPPLETRMKMAWDDSCLYIAARLEEPHIFGTLTGRDEIIFRDPDFEVFADPDGDACNYYEFEINSLGTVMDLFLARSYINGGAPDMVWDFTGLRSDVHLAGSLNDPSDTDTGWTVEIAIPWEAFRRGDHTDSMPVPGSSWRFNFSRVQWPLEFTPGGYRKASNPHTGKPLREENWVWSSTGKINMHLPEEWGFVEFSGESPPPKFWVWAGGGNRTSAAWEALLRGLDTLGIRGLLLNADTATLAQVASLANPLGLEIHAWVWTMNRGDADPSWLDYNRLGHSLADSEAYVGYYRFMNPAVVEVGNFLQEKFLELASVKGLKGIHMDYIRYVDAILPEGLQPTYGLVQDRILPKFDYGYHPAMMELFSGRYGLDPVRDTAALTDSLWLRFRLEKLNELVIRLRDQVRQSHLAVSAAVFPTPELSREMVRQDWQCWGLDRYFPMVYHNFYNKSYDWIRRVMKENKRLLPATQVYGGLYLPALQQDDDLTKALEAAFEGGADGVALFELGSLTEPVRRQIAKFRKFAW